MNGVPTVGGGAAGTRGEDREGEETWEVCDLSELRDLRRAFIAGRCAIATLHYTVNRLPPYLPFLPLMFLAGTFTPNKARRLRPPGLRAEVKVISPCEQQLELYRQCNVMQSMQ